MRWSRRDWSGLGLVIGVLGVRCRRSGFRFQETMVRCIFRRRKLIHCGTSNLRVRRASSQLQVRSSQTSFSGLRDGTGERFKDFVHKSARAHEASLRVLARACPLWLFVIDVFVRHRDVLFHKDCRASRDRADDGVCPRWLFAMLVVLVPQITVEAGRIH